MLVQFRTRALERPRCHPLKGELAGTYAIDLTGFMRLIFSVGERDTVTIERVSKHYGD